MNNEQYKPADRAEIIAVLEGALVDEVIGHHSAEWVERARNAISALQAPTPSAGTIDTAEFQKLLLNYSALYEDASVLSEQSRDALVTYIMDWHSAGVAAARDEGHITGRRNGVREANADAAETIEELNTALAAAREQAHKLVLRMYTHHCTTSFPLVCHNYGSRDAMEAEGQKLWREEVPAYLASQPASTSPIAAPVVQDAQYFAVRTNGGWPQFAPDQAAAEKLAAPLRRQGDTVEIIALAAPAPVSVAPVLTGDQKIVAWYDPSNTDPGQSVTFKREVHEKWPHIYRVPLVAASSPAAPVGLDQLHSAIMNLPCVVDELYNESQARMYKIGHRDARHDAAELVAATQAERQEQVVDVERDAARYRWLRASGQMVASSVGDNGKIAMPGYRPTEEMLATLDARLDAAIQQSQQQGERSDG